ncbi:hypothetical protein PIROE2DRAFT_62794 [Piromyces sp. E2]|nr:hypothetical protein PIROE2DRAFT_62794 [Piromyces sp. E2]|eukprot:OUM60992.1 hypothetical protein PIROE2DRAFT_62794 [Piromyces sp. E2]
MSQYLSILKYYIFVITIFTFICKVTAYGWGKNFDSDWMKYINGNLKLNQINIPGTHDSGTFGLTGQILEPMARTQSLSIKKQLETGVRYFDIRLGVKDGDDKIVVVHENFHCRFNDVISICEKFLKNHKTETIIIHIKDEHRTTCTEYKFDKPYVTTCEPTDKIDIVKKYGINITNNNIPKLDDVRDSYGITDVSKKWNVIEKLINDQSEIEQKEIIK